MNEVIHVIQRFEFRNEFWCLILPIILMGFDILTGFVNAWAKREIQSKKLRTGLSKKVGEIAILVIGEFISFALRVPPEVMKFLSLYIILMEIVSIFENLNKMGIPIPKFISNVFNNVSDTIVNSDDVKDIAEAIETEKEAINDKTGNDRKSN